MSPSPSSALAAANERGNRAFAAGELRAAAEAYAEAVRLLEPPDDPLAPLVYENLGLALYNLGRYRPAIRAFLRALDGRPASREQSLRLLLSALACDGRALDALHHLRIYEQTFGPHPHGWTTDALRRLHQELRQRKAKAFPC